MKKETWMRLLFFVEGMAVCYGVGFFFNRSATISIQNGRNTELKSIRILCQSDNMAIEALALQPNQKFDFRIPVGSEGGCQGQFLDSQSQIVPIPPRELGYVEDGGHYSLVITESGVDRK